jgi:phosphate transport system protein
MMAVVAEDLRTIEKQAVEALDMVVTQLDRAVEALNYQDVELAAMVIADDDHIDDLYLEIHQGVITLLSRGPRNDEEVRMLAALLHIIRCIERMGDQCTNMAKLVPLSGYEAPKDSVILELIEKMGISARQEVLQAKDAFRMRHVTLAKDLVRQDADVNRLNREIFQRAVEIGDDPEKREWAMYMVLVARCLERIGDNTVDIAEQTAFVVSGLFREFTAEDIPN